MRAVVYNGPRDVAVQKVPDAKIEKAHRRPGPDHEHQHLRVGPAQVRGPDGLPARRRLRPREPRSGLKLPPDAEERQNDYVMLADIFPTGWHGTELAGVCPGESVVIFGAGPVGLMAAHSGRERPSCSPRVQPS